MEQNKFSMWLLFSHLSNQHMVKVLVTVKAGNINMDKLIQLIQSRSIKAFGKKKKSVCVSQGWTVMDWLTLLIEQKYIYLHVQVFRGLTGAVAKLLYIVFDKSW